MKELEQLKRDKKKIIFTNGCFDILHIGHIKYLQKAKKLGDILVVGLNSDSSVRKLKGKNRPINKENIRRDFLLALSCVDLVFIFDELTPKNLIKRIKPDILVKGGDWKLSDIVGSKFVKKNGGEVKSLNFEDGFSSTIMIEKIVKAYGN